eukprot:358412-Chlamydomonas_euryale.AAC.1
MRPGSSRRLGGRVRGQCQDLHIGAGEGEGGEKATMRHGSQVHGRETAHVWGRAHGVEKRAMGRARRRAQRCVHRSLFICTVKQRAEEGRLRVHGHCHLTQPLAIKHRANQRLYVLVHRLLAAVLAKDLVKAKEPHAVGRAGIVHRQLAALARLQAHAAALARRAGRPDPAKHSDRALEVLHLRTRRGGARRLRSVMYVTAGVPGMPGAYCVQGREEQSSVGGAAA